MDDAATPEAAPHDLVAAMAFDPMTGIDDLDLHLTAMKDRADALGYPFDRHAIRNELQAATFRLRGAAAVLLLLSPTGATAILSTPRA